MSERKPASKDQEIIFTVKGLFHKYPDSASKRRVFEVLELGQEHGQALAAARFVLDHAVGHKCSEDYFPESFVAKFEQSIGI
jgi:hypothetical protein